MRRRSLLFFVPLTVGALALMTVTGDVTGAVTPARCIPLAANAGIELNYRGQPAFFSTGITIALK